MLPAVLLLGALIGAGQGAVIHFFKVEPFIATLAGLFLARGLASADRGEFELAHEEADMTVRWVPVDELADDALAAREAHVRLDPHPADRDEPGSSVAG